MGHAARVAAVTTAAIAIVYVACVTVLNLAVSAHLTAQVDGRLAARLTELQEQPDDIIRQVSRRASRRTAMPTLTMKARRSWPGC